MVCVNGYTVFGGVLRRPKILINGLGCRHGPQGPSLNAKLHTVTLGEPLLKP